MEEVSEFIQTSLSSLPGTSKGDANKVSNTYQGLAQVFQRVADDLREKGQAVNGDGEPESQIRKSGSVDVLLDFAEKGRKAVEEVKRTQA